VLEVVAFGAVVVVVVLVGVDVAEGEFFAAATAIGWPAISVGLLSATAVPVTATSNAAAATTDHHRLGNTNSYVTREMATSIA